MIISGYWGIRPSWKGLVKYSVLCIFYCVLGYLCGGGKITVAGLAKSSVFLSMKYTGLWFVGTYFYLYCISPIVNAWHNSITTRTLEKYIICFALFDFLLGYAMESDIVSMPIHFVLLYSIGHYLRVSDRKWVQQSSVVSSTTKYVGVTILLLSYAIILVMLKGEAHKCFSYLNPLITIQSVFVFLIFTKMSIKKSSIINWLAASTFPVYLLSEILYMRHWFVEIVQGIKRNTDGLGFVITFSLFCIAAYFLLLMVDKLLSKAYVPITKTIIKKLQL